MTHRTDNEKVSTGHPESARWSTLAIVGFVVSFVWSIPGLIISILGVRQAIRTGRRGLGLAIAGIVISCVELVLGAFVAGVLLLGNPLPVLEDQMAPPPKGAAHFGEADRLPATSGPQGVHQSLVAQGWTPLATTSPSAFIASAVDAPLSYEDSTKSCIVDIEFGAGTTSDDSSLTRYEDSHSTLSSFTLPDDGSRQPTGPLTFAMAPAFDASGGAMQAPSGAYQVVQSSFSNADAPDRAAIAWAREFRTGKHAIFDIVTSATCKDSTTLRSIGIPALEHGVGAAW